MTPVRLLFLGAAGLVAAFLAAGCASAPHAQVIVPTADQVQITVHPWRRAVRLVAKAPSRERYFFVGRVRGSAPDDEFVTAAKTAREDLQTKAEALGADVVKIDRVAANEQSHRVLLAGRAYRLIN